MQRVVLPDFDPDSLQAAVDIVYYARGVQYARQGAVVQARWDPIRQELQGLVRGSGGAHYTAIAYFSQADGRSLEFERGICSCPVGTDCKHVIALALTAVQGEPGPRQVAPAAAGPARGAPTPAWPASPEPLLEPRPSASSVRGPPR